MFFFAFFWQPHELESSVSAAGRGTVRVRSNSGNENIQLKEGKGRGESLERRLQRDSVHGQGPAHGQTETENNNDDWAFGVSDQFNSLWDGDSADLTLNAIRQQFDDLALSGYQPVESVAFVIPVGGKTERSASLERIINVLTAGGAKAENIFVFEDVQSRPQRLPSKAVHAVVDKTAIQYRQSFVPRNAPETAENFGIHLSRHYHAMLDMLLLHNKNHSTNAQNDGNGIVSDNAARSASVYEFAVVIEDDLELAIDFVKFFFEMSKVMKVDDTLFCVSAHNDNAFPATADETIHSDKLSNAAFDFRRGNHFMAPGWMISRDVYLRLIRPSWLDAEGNYVSKTRLHLKNGHWDRFFDALIGTRDCIFPEVARIVHQGADGFTVSQQGQLDLYANVKLSHLPLFVDYGDLSRLTAVGYLHEKIQFVRHAKMLSVLEEVILYRHAPLFFIVPALDDRDEEWNLVLNHFFGLIGVGGYGGWTGYVKVRGIQQGAVFVRWISNLILLVAPYSPIAKYVNTPAVTRKHTPDVNLVNAPSVAQSVAESDAKVAPSDRADVVDGAGAGAGDGDGAGVAHGDSANWVALSPSFLASFKLNSLGCFVDSWQRDLPTPVLWYSQKSLSPFRCLLSCHFLGYSYAAIQNGRECWCGNSYGQYGAVNTSKAQQQTCQPCADSLNDSPWFNEHAVEQWSKRTSLWSAATDLLHRAVRFFHRGSSGQDEQGDVKHNGAQSHLLCGGALLNSVYENGWTKSKGMSQSQSNVLDMESQLHLHDSERFARPPTDAMYVRARESESCSAACHRVTNGARACAVWLFPLLSQSCEALRLLLSCSAASGCAAESDTGRGFSTPGVLWSDSNNESKCFVSKGRYLRCDQAPIQENFVRACVCA